MNRPLSMAPHPQSTPPSLGVTSLRALVAEAFSRQSTLTLFGLLMWAAMVPTLLAWGLDDRVLRGANVWVKPLKFMASVGLFALCTAWFVGLLPNQQRTHWSVRLVVWVLIGAGLFEVVYITTQAALGAASHYNTSSLFHGVMYTLMGAGALAMTATQPLLAWRIARHARPDLPAVWRDAVVIGLVLTFLFGASSGFMLGGAQPPAGAGLPLLGWHLDGGDIRPAHFIGIHAQQWIPFTGLLLTGLAPAHARRMLMAVTLLVSTLWLWAMTKGLEGVAFVAPAMAF